MARLISVGVCLRYIGAAAVLSLAAVSLLNAASEATAGISQTAPTIMVNRNLKGDRLPLFKPVVSGPTKVKPMASPNEPAGLEQSQTRKQMPIGCDPAFSPVSSPSLAHVYGRCMV